MRNYETTFIVDPVLSGDDVQAAAKVYMDWLTNYGCTIVHTNEMGLQQLAYPIRKKHSGYYFCIEFTSPDGQFVNKLELQMMRDERILRFLTVSLDKHGVQYNLDKRAGIIGKRRREIKEARAVAEAERIANLPPPSDTRGVGRAIRPQPVAAPVEAAPEVVAPEPEVVATAPTELAND